jgi:hypothetical protein
MKSGQKKWARSTKAEQKLMDRNTRNNSKAKFYELHNSLDEIMYFLLKDILNNF